MIKYHKVKECYTLAGGGKNAPEKLVEKLMKKIIACFCRGGGNPLNYLCAVLLALALAPSAFGAPTYTARLTVAGYTGSSTLEDFPVLVRLSPQTIDGFSYSACAQNGSDISFVAADGETLLPYDIDTWDETGTSLIWVKVPEVASSGTTFTIRWGDDEPPANTPADTWAGYKSVWHMDITTENNKYVTSDVIAGHKVTAQTTDQFNGPGAGPVGGCYHNEDNTANRGMRGSVAAGFQATTKSVATYSIWVKQIGGTCLSGYPDQATYPKIKWGSWGNCGSALCTKSSVSSADGISIDLEGKANQLNTMVVRCKSNSDTTTTTITIPSIYDKAWHHLVLTFDGTERRFYVDGVVQPGFTANTTFNNPGNIDINFGCRADSANKDCMWTGDLDEIRFRDAHSSADWVAAEYANVVDADFLAYGAAQAGDGTVWVKGAPVEAGVPTPAYGFNAGYSANDPVTFSMAATEVPGEGTVTNYLAGWLFESVDPATQARTTIASSEDQGAAIGSYTGTYAGYSEFTWLWDVRDAVGLGALSAAVNRGTSIDLAVEVTGLGYEANASATLTVAYGLVADDLDKTETAAVSARGTATVSIPRLQPGTIYYFQATLDNGVDAPFVSAVVPFTAASLSTGMRRIEYIEGTGDQYIDTLYKPTPATRALVDFQYTAKSGNTSVFGLATGDMSYSFLANSQGYWAYCVADSNSEKVLTPATQRDLERILIDFNYVDGDDRAIAVYTNGAVMASQSPIENTATRNATYSLALAAKRTSTGGRIDSFQSESRSHRIYSARFYEGAELKFALSPVALDAGGVVFYDAVSKAYFANAKSSDSTSYPAYTKGGPAVGTTLAVEDNQRVIKLTFLAAPMDRPLRLAYGPDFAGDDPADWATTVAVTTVPSGATSATVPFPETWGDDNTFVVRCYFDDGTSFPLWSDPFVFSDAAAPVLNSVAADGTGGDTLVVSGNLADFPGNDCTLTVYTGTSADDLAQTWTELDGSVRTVPGTFSLALYESDTESARYIAPSSTVYVAVEAVANGKTVRSSVVSATMKGAPAFGANTESVTKNKVTFTANLEDAGAGGAAVVTLYVGESKSESELTAVETPKTVSNIENFAFSHTFPEVGKTYYYQLRAVSTTTGGELPLETRTAVKAVATKDDTTYVWKPVDGNWNGDWSDPAHWVPNATPNLGYPHAPDAIASFENCTTNNPVVVNVDGKYEVNILRWQGTDASDVTFTGAGVAESSLSCNIYNHSSNDRVRSNSRVEFRDMTLTRKGDWEILRGHPEVTNVTVRLSNVKSTGAYFSLCSPACRFEFANGSDVTTTKINVGGTNTVFVLDDSIARIGTSGFFVNADIAPTSAGDVDVFIRGKNAQFTGTSFYIYRAHNPDYNMNVHLEVPVGGYANTPISLSTLGNGVVATDKGKIRFIVEENSPALRKSKDELTDHCIVTATTLMKAAVADGIGMLPVHDYGSGEEACGEFKYSSNSKQILLDLRGHSSAVRGTMILLR